MIPKEDMTAETHFTAEDYYSADSCHQLAESTVADLAEKVNLKIEKRNFHEMCQKSSQNCNYSENLEPCGGKIGIYLMKFRKRFNRLCSLDNSRNINLIRFLVLAGVSGYLALVAVRWSYSDCSDIDWTNGFGFLLIVYFLFALTTISKLSRRLIPKLADKLNQTLLTRIKIGIWYLYNLIIAVSVIVSVVVIMLDAVSEGRRLLSLFGYLVILLLSFLFSKHPDYINWRIVGRGVCLHVIVALAIIKWSTGRAILKVFSDKVVGFMNFSYSGARFVYGDFLVDQGIFLFKSLSVLFLVATIINILLYYGTLQSAFQYLGKIMQYLLGTSVVESAGAVVAVFLGTAEGSLLFVSYLHHMSASEIHAIMTVFFASIAGSIMSAYVTLGASASSIMAASAMAVPASLTISKLLLPETQQKQNTNENVIIQKSDDADNVVDAACKGAMLASQIVPAIAANLIACVAVIAFLDSVLSWFGVLAGVKDLTFEKSVGYLFIPLTWTMGVSPADVEIVARLIGIKTVANEIIGYKEFGYVKHKLSVRSQAIATYAMCGFANPGAVAVLVSGLITVCPEKRQVITQMAFRAFVAGSFASFLSASLAGFLTPENGFTSHNSFQLNDTSTSTNETSCYLYTWK